MSLNIFETFKDFVRNSFAPKLRLSLVKAFVRALCPAGCDPDLGFVDSGRLMTRLTSIGIHKIDNRHKLLF